MTSVAIIQRVLARASLRGITGPSQRRSLPPPSIRVGYQGESPKPPNKAPEPTTTSVTPRAILRSSEVKQRTEARSEARVVPAAVVAHL